MAEIQLPARSRAGGSQRRRSGNIPTAADVPTVGIQRDPGLQVPKFGDGEGLVAAGKGLMDFGHSVDIAAQRQQKLFDATATTEGQLSFEKQGMEEFNRLQTEDDPARLGFVPDFEKWLGGRQKDVLANLPKGTSSEAQERLRLKLLASQQGMTQAAGRLSLQEGQKKAQDAIGQQVNKWSAQASRDPDFLDAFLDTADIDLSEFEGSMTANAERDTRTKARAAIIESGISGLVARNRYKDAENIVSSGKYDADLSPQSVARIEADIQRGKRVAAGEIRELSNDHLASIETTGGGIPGLADKASKILDPKDLSEFKAKENIAKRVYDIGRTIEFSPPDAIVANLEAIRPKSGSPNFADELRAYEGTARRANQILKARADDPAGYALGMPEVKAAWDAAGQDQGGSVAYAAKSLAAQEAMGIPESSRRVLPESVAKRIVTDLTAPGNDERAADMIEGMSKQYGNYWGRAYRDLVREKLPPEMTTLAMLDGPQDAVVRRDLAGALKVGRKTLSDNIASADKTDIDKNLQDALAPWAKVELARGGNERNVQALRNSAELLAYSYAAKGMSGSDSAKAAAKALALDRYDILDGRNFALYAPKGQGDLVETTGRAILSDLKVDQLPDPGGAPQLTEIQRKEAYLKAIKRGRWVLDETGEGAVLLDEIGQPVRVTSEHGIERLGFRFKDMSPAGISETGPDFERPF